MSDWETLVAEGTTNTWIDNYPNQTRTRYYEVPYDGVIIILGKNRNIGANNVIEISNDKGNTWEVIGWNYSDAGSTNTIPVKKNQYICAGGSESAKFTSALGAFYKHRDYSNR